MEIRVLRYFLVVAREGNITKAAKFLHISQPTLSRQLKELEAELGKPLYVRNSHNISLTDEGMLLRKRAEDILDMVDKTTDEFKALDEFYGGDIYIGCAESRGFEQFMDVATALQNKFPNIRFHFYSSGTDAVNERLDRGLLDFAIIVQRVNLEKYNYLKIPYSDQWGVLMRKDDPLASKGTLSLDDIKKLSLICSRQGLEEELLEWFGESMDSLNIVATYDMLFNTSIMAEKKFGYPIGFKDLIYTGTESSLCFKPLSPSLYSPMHIIWKKYQVFTPAAELLLEELKRFLSQPHE